MRTGLCKCHACGEVFDEDDLIVDRYEECVGEFWGSPAYETFEEYTCPECGEQDEIEFDYVEPDDDEEEE